MRLEQLQYFVEVGLQASISKASEKLYTTPQNISKAIRQLEEELGVKLFHRFRNGMFLTEEGLSAFETASNIVGEIDKLKSTFSSRVSTDAKNKSLSLSVLLTPLLNDTFISVLNRMTHNGIVFDQLSISQTDITNINCQFENSSRTLSQKYDIIITAFDSSDYEKNRQILSEQFAAYRLWLDRVCLEVDRNDPFAKKRVITLAELSELNFLMYTSDAFSPTFTELVFLKRGIKLNVPYRVPGETGKRFSQAQKMYSILGTPTNELRPRPGTVLVPIEGPIYTDHWILVPREKLHIAAVRETLQNLDELFSTEKLF